MNNRPTLFLGARSAFALVLFLSFFAFPIVSKNAIASNNQAETGIIFFDIEFSQAKYRTLARELSDLMLASLARTTRTRINIAPTPAECALGDTLCLCRQVEDFLEKEFIATSLYHDNGGEYLRISRFAVDDCALLSQVNLSISEKNGDKRKSMQKTVEKLFSINPPIEPNKKRETYLESEAQPFQPDTQNTKPRSRREHTRLLLSENNRRPDLMNIFPTALNQPEQTIELDFFYLAFVDIAYQATKNVRFGSIVVLPAYVYGAMPHLSFSFEIEPKSYLGGIVMGGFFTPMWTNTPYYAAAAGVVYSYGEGKASFTASFLGGGYGEGKQFEQAGYLMPMVGGAYKFHKRLIFHIELAPMIEIAERSDLPFVLLSYGLRIQGSTRGYGDLGFWMPLSNSWFTNEAEIFGMDGAYFPMGVPFLRFGVVF